MPTPDGKLTPEELDKAKNWLLEHLARQGCPICQNQQWSIADMLVMAPQFTGSGINLGPGIPLAVVFCARCTFVRFHSAIAMGLAQADPPKAANG